MFCASLFDIFKKQKTFITNHSSGRQKTPPLISIVGLQMKKNTIIVILLLSNFALISYILIGKFAHRSANYAIELAQKSHSLSNEPMLNNDQFIQTEIKKISGKLTIDGWIATRIHDDTFLVEYRYDRSHASWDHDTRYLFEVKISQDLVRNVIGDYELEELYRLIDKEERLYKTCYKSFNDNKAHFYEKGTLDVWGIVVLYPSFINIIKYNHANGKPFNSEKFFGVARKPYIEALIKAFSDNSEGNNLPQVFHKEYGDSISVYHHILMDILNSALNNADD